MVESGAVPQVSRLRRRALDLARAVTTPLLPDDYLALVNPRWSTRELTGRVVRVRRETADATTVVIRPDFPWPPHTPGQYLRIGMRIDGIRRWRAYTITSDPRHPEGVVSITVKHTEGGIMSPVFARHVHPGAAVFLGEVEGEFVLPEPLPARLLMISAGSGITPLLAMVRELQRRGALDGAGPRVVHVHSSRTAEDMIFGRLLRRTAARHEGYELVEVHTGEQPRVGPDRLDALCPDWRGRTTFASGPRDLLDALDEHWTEAGIGDRLLMERFQPVIGIGGGDGSGGTVRFRVTEHEAACEAGVSILVGGEQAGATLPFGCRMGICHTCVGRLRDGAVRDLRTGAITHADGQMVRTCINAPEGHVEIDL